MPNRVDIDPDRRTLHFNGAPVKLGSRAFELLLALAARPGHLVTKAELLQAAWGHLEVADFNLHVQMSALRKHLGRDAVVTLPGRGYLFTLHVPGIAAAAVAPADEAARHRLFGRDGDIDAVCRLLRRHALVVVSGAGGIGKTALARAVLRALPGGFADGTAQVDASTLASKAELALALAAALRVTPRSADPVAALAQALRPLQALILIDNAEALIGAAGELVEILLDTCPTLRFLVTSQVRLDVVRAIHYRLEPLRFPDAPLRAEAALGYSAVAMLDARLRGVDARFELDEDNAAAAIDVCRALDGLPLALEIAAARAGTLGLPMLRAQLHTRLSWPSGHADAVPDRQQTLAAVMAWSESLLGPRERDAFARLGVFAGGFTLEMLHGMFGDSPGDADGHADLLAELVDHCLVHLDVGVPTRYRLLETARLYALGQLDRGARTDAARRAHAQTLLGVFELAYTQCWHTPEAEFVARYEPELDNLRAALRWSMPYDAHAAIALAGASGRLWRWLSLHSEGLRWLERAATLIDA